MKKFCKEFGKRFDPVKVFGRMIILVCVVVLAGLMANYSSKKHAEMQKQQQEEKQPKLVKRNVQRLSHDDFWCYQIIENHLRLNIALYNGTVDEQQAIASNIAFVEWLKQIKNAQQFEDLEIYDRIDELIFNVQQEKTFMEDPQFVNACTEMLKYFQNCRENGETFQSAVDNCPPTLVGPELG